MRPNIREIRKEVPQADARSAILRIIIWQNVLSIHQSAFVRALASHPEMEVYFAYEEDLPDSRKAMGWTIPDYGRATVIDSRDPEIWRKLVFMDDSATVHLFGSYFILPMAYAAFRELRGRSCRLIWTTEAFDFHGWRGWIRIQRARWHAMREARRGFHLVFAMGTLGMDFYKRAWLRTEQLREFGYLVEARPALNSPPGGASDGIFHLVFIGQLIPRKGVDYLIDAIALIPREDWKLDIVGDGPERRGLQDLASSRGVLERVSFHGNQSNEYALEMIRRADALVLSSRWDGWGAVVNESLMQGTPVIVSDTCGAASLVVNDLCGEVFQNRSIESLANTITRRMRAGRVCPDNRYRLSKWANQQLSGPALVNYFFDCLHDENNAGLKLVPWRAHHPETTTGA